MKASECVIVDGMLGITAKHRQQPDPGSAYACVFAAEDKVETREMH